MMKEIRKGYLRIAGIALLLLAGSVAAICQPDGFGPPPDGQSSGDDQQSMHQRGPSADRELKKLTQLLSLTSDQQSAAKLILTDQQSQIRALMQRARSAQQSSATTSSDATTTSTDGRPARPSREAMEAMRAQMKTIRSATQTKIAALLTDTQKATYAAYIEKQEKAQAERQQSDTPPPPPDGGEGGPPPDGGGPGGGPDGGGPGGGGPGGGGPGGDF